MISGLLKLMGRFRLARHRTDLEVPFEMYSNTGDSLGSRQIQPAQLVREPYWLSEHCVRVGTVVRRRRIRQLVAVQLAVRLLTNQCTRFMFRIIEYRKG